MELRSSLTALTALSLATALASGTITPAAAQTAPAPSPAADAPEPGTITVTARKRGEDILKVPVTVTAITSEAIEQRGIVSMNDMANATPGININNNSSGHADRSFQEVSLRGFTPYGVLGTTTSMFIDGVPVGSPSALTSISDPERIEVLKGPQSAYFGRNTFAGAINLVNKEPRSGWHGSLSVMGGTHANWRVQGSLEGTLIEDVLSFRATGDRFSKSGSWVNAANPSQTLGDQSSSNFSLLVVAKPVSGLTIKLFGMHVTDRDGPAAQTRLVTRNVYNSNGSLALAGQSNCTTAAGYSWICGTAPNLVNAVSANTTVNANMRSWMSGLTRNLSGSDAITDYGLLRHTKHAHANIEYKLSPEVSATLLAGFNEESWSTMIDLDGFDTSGIADPGMASLQPYYDWAYLVDQKNRDASVEGRVNLTHGPLRGVVGASYIFQKANQGLGGSLFGGSYSIYGPSTSKTLGAYFGLTYDITDQLSASFEGRYQVDTMATYTYGVATPSAEKSFRKFLPRAIVNYQIDPDTMVYASFAQGVNPSTFNNISSWDAATQTKAATLGLKAAVDPERVTNYELGLKGKLLNGAIRYTAAAYYAQWRNQVASISFVSNGGLYSGNANSGSVDLYGIEGQVFWKVNDLITIDAAGAVNASRYNYYAVNGAITAAGVYSGITDFRGKEMPNTSKYSSNIGITLGGDVKQLGDAKWFWRTDWTYKSGMWSDQANTVQTRDLHLFNTRVGVDRGPVSVNVFVNNIFNNHTYTSISGNWILDPAGVFGLFAGANQYSSTFVGLPDLRTIGVQVKLKI
ncbi:TonB-dependent receptor [Novosphingobium sp. FSY-8]|uniref:TonB-dependent receptor n=1 Tax=Novosphingobium ovatum TaxID=1908523 RepID=A0ABW9XBR8_9SPHN|nr:TonB-dependent receptor [Novosphingobium ovatum]NBC35968.1 TonB-dependent receptor [Novosphingobium ovatum]